MKRLSTLTAALTLIILTPFLLASPHNVSAVSQGASEIDLWAVIRLRDFARDMPISNVSVSATVSSSWGDATVGPASTNETGVIQVYLGRKTNLTWPSTPRLNVLHLFSNYTIIKVGDLFMEDADISSEYTLNHASYSLWQTRVYLGLESRGNQTLIEVDLWALPGKLVWVSDQDPFTGERQTLTVKPALKANIWEDRKYESYYFFPLNYPVTITAPGYSPVAVTVNENTVLVNWMYHAAEAYADDRLSSVNEKVNWFRPLGFPLFQQVEDIRTIRYLMDRSLKLLLEEDYSHAIGGANAAMEKLSNLEKGLPNLKVFSVLTSIGLCFFAYGLASLIPYLIFEERMRGKIRLVSKPLVFSSVLLLFSFTQPCMKLVFAVLLESALHVPTWGVDLPTTLWGSFFLGSILYLIFMVISMKETPITDLALNLGVRELKRRRFRTILTLVTLTIIVASAVSLINISAGHVISVSGSWEGTDTPGVIIQADITSGLVRPLSEYDINWIYGQAWCKDLGYQEEIQRYDPEKGSSLADIIFIDALEFPAKIVGIDPAFMETHHQLRKYIKGGYFTSGEAAVILPSTYEGVMIGDDVTLAVGEWLPMAIEPIIRTMGTFRVVGKFDPESLSKARGIDNKPLFERTHILVLVPIKAITTPYMVISRATILTKSDVDPMDVAREIVFTLGHAATANKEGLAVRIEWAFELQATGVASFIFPLIISGLMVYTTMASVYEERRGEFTSLATLGLDPKNVFRIFMAEVLILGLLATFLGFFGSYITVPVLSPVLTFLRGHGIPAPDLPVTYVNWSLSGIIVALLTGTVTTFLGGCVPAMRAQGISLLGHMKKRRLSGELITEEETTSFLLPVKVLAQDGEMLYNFTLEKLARARALVDPHSIKGEMYRDGSFVVSFAAFDPSLAVSCKLRGVRVGENLVPTVEFPTSYKSYEKMEDMLRGLEERMIAFPSWMETQRKVIISRRAPKKRKTPEDILVDVRGMLDQIKDGTSKLKELEALRRAKLSDEVYTEFKEKYTKKVEELFKRLRSMAIGLEPYHDQLRQEIKDLNLKIERITTAHTLGEISREEYETTCGPLQAKQAALTGRTKELEEIFQLLKIPSRAL